MKKKGILIIILILGLMMLAGLVTKYIDTANVTTGHEPECCLKIVSEDGSRVTYWGLGYKVIRYVSVSPKEPFENNNGVKMGSWLMRFDKPSDHKSMEIESLLDDKVILVTDNDAVDFMIGLLEYSKYIDKPCDGIYTHRIDYNGATYHILLDCQAINKDGKQAKMTDADRKQFEKIMASAADKRRIYTYEESVEQTMKPNLFLDTENQRFSFFFSMLSSYLAQGTYERTENMLICKTDDGNNTYTFEVLEDGYKFIANQSSKIPKYKYTSDAKEALAPVVDGAVFR